MGCKHCEFLRATCDRLEQRLETATNIGLERQVQVVTMWPVVEAVVNNRQWLKRADIIKAVDTYLAAQQAAEKEAADGNV